MPGQAQVWHGQCFAARTTAAEARVAVYPSTRPLRSHLMSYTTYVRVRQKRHTTVDRWCADTHNHPANRPSCDRTYTEGSMPPDKPTYKRGIGHRPQATCPLAYSITWRSTVLRARLLLPNCIVRARIPPGHVRAEQFGVLP